MKKSMQVLRKFAVLTAAVVSLMTIAGNFSAAQIVGVDFGGDYDGGLGSRNSPLIHIVQQDTGDFNGDAITDSREFVPIDTPQFFVELDVVGFPGLAGKNNKIHAGAQNVNYFTAAAPTGIGLLRWEGTSLNGLQMTSGQIGTASMGMAFTPHVKKSEFLNDLDAAANVSFADLTDGVSMQWEHGGTPTAGVGIRRNRLLIQNGSDWFISESTSGSKTRNAANPFSLNPFSETFYSFDPSTNFFYEEVSDVDTTPVGVGVLGSTFTNIQALGVHMMNTGFNGFIIHNSNMRLLDFSANLASSGLSGDFDDDGDVDGNDFLEWQRKDGTPGGLTDWETNYGMVALTAAVSAVPEPSTCLILQAGLLAWLVRRNRYSR
jgi:hypothetical protein